MTKAQTQKALVQIGTDLAAAWETKVSSARMEVASYLYEGGKLCDAIELPFGEWAGKYLPDESKSSLSRLRAAYAVRVVIGDMEPGKLTERNAEPLYTFISRKGLTDEERAAAEDSLRNVWGTVSQTDGGKAPTIDAVTKAVHKARGTKPKPKASGSGAGTPKNRPQDGDEPTVAEIDPAAVEASAETIGSILKSAKRKGVAENVTLAIVLATVRACETHGTLNVAAAIQAAK